MPGGGAALRGGAEFGNQVDGAVADGGDVSPTSQCGRIRSPLHGHRAWLLELVAAAPGVTLAEVQARLLGDLGQASTTAAIWRFFAREGISFNKNAAAIRAGQARRPAQAGELEALSGADRG